MSNNSELTDKVNIQIAYLNILQNIINRMSTFGIAMQSASVTTLTALLAYASTTSIDAFKLWMFFVPWLFFAGYNAFFLRTERAFRERYNQITNKDNISFVDFRINKDDLNTLYQQTESCHWLNVIFSRVFITCHLVIFIVIILFAYFKGISCF